MGTGSATIKIVRALSLSAFLATLLIYSPNVMVLQSFDRQGLTGFFAEPCLLITLAMSAVIAGLAYARPRALDLFLDRRLVVWSAIGLYGISNVAYAAAVILAPEASLILATVSAIACGLCVVPVCLVWRRALRGFDFCDAVLIMALGGALATVADSFIKFFSPLGAFAAFSLLVVGGLVYPSGIQLRSAGGSHEQAIDAESSPVEPRRIDMRAFLSVMGVPLLGMAISSFAMGVRPAFIFDGTMDAQRIAMLAGGFALLPLAFMRSFRPIFSFTHQVYLALAATVALVACALSPDLVSQDVMTVVIYAFYCMVTVVACAAALAVANVQEFSPSFVFATVVGTFCLMGTAGIFVGARMSWLTTGDSLLLLVLTALYASGILVSGCIGSWRSTANPNNGSGKTLGAPESAELAETLEQRISRLARDAGLSPRETEIFEYVGRGHSAVFVAKTLLISESTVYSHVRNVYRKLGVGSREELIQLLNDSSKGPFQ